MRSRAGLGFGPSVRVLCSCTTAVVCWLAGAASLSGCNRADDGARTPTTQASQPARTSGSKDTWEWFDQQTPAWREMEVVTVDTVEAGVDLALTWATHRIPGPSVDDLQLAGDLGRFLFAWTRGTGAEYLAAQAGSLRLPDSTTDIADAARVFEHRLARPPASPSEIMDALWTDPSGVGRPSAFSRPSRFMISQSGRLSLIPPKDVKNPLMAVRPPITPYDGLPPDELSKWLGYSSITFPRVTLNRVSAESILRARDTAMVAQVGCIVQTSTNTRFPISLFLYQDPDSSEWFVYLAGTAYPQPISWPL